MSAKRFTGPQAGSQKYDLLTAMSVAGLHGTAGFQTSMLRLVALVTARYNWSRDELTVGQREMAQLWSVDERTVKREIKRLVTAGILLQLRPGVRGRVAAYRLCLPEIYRLSAPVWDRVGPDFSARMEQQAPGTTEPNIVHVAFGTPSEESPQPEPPTTSSAAWNRSLNRLQKLEPAQFRSWFATLGFRDFTDGVLTLTAPSSFAASYVTSHHLPLVTGAARFEFPSLSRIVIDHLRS
ncbi:DnaA N-terminal domain-containing protein [Salipiger bermudensis]|uniref:DnaA N-terminal domain-containing protein n=1 Tax=Salipiger bermudensis TaxID=344736 RepID=UPI00300A4129